MPERTKEDETSIDVQGKDLRKKFEFLFENQLISLRNLQSQKPTGGFKMLGKERSDIFDINISFGKS
jgi:hypothetical protein